MWPVARQFSFTHAQNGTNLGIVRRSPVPFFSSCWENHTSRSFSVPSKKCALLSFIMGQQTPQQTRSTVGWDLHNLRNPRSIGEILLR